MSSLSVVILNWNGMDLLKEFLPRVLDNTDPDIADVIVADNGSTDGSVDYLKWLGVAVISFYRNHGFAGGYNLALERVSTPYSVLLNSDVAPAPGWINQLVEFMDAHPEVGACQPKCHASPHIGSRGLRRLLAEIAYTSKERLVPFRTPRIGAHPLVAFRYGIILGNDPDIRFPLDSQSWHSQVLDLIGMG